MARYGWQDIDLILLSGHDLHAMGILELDTPAPQATTEELPYAGDVWPTVVDTGIRSVDGPFQLLTAYDDTATTGSEAVLVTLSHHANAVFTVALAGATLGDPVLAAQVDQVSYDYVTARDEVTKLDVSFSVDGELYQPKIVYPKTTVTADGDSESASLDNAASTANGGVAILHVSAADYDGGTGIDVKVRHSADDITYGDLASFASVTAAQGGEILTVAAGSTVNRYLAASWDFTGTPGGSATADVFVAFQRK